MKSNSLRNLSLNLILFILLLNMVLQQDYYFQMYPSLDEDKPYLFHAYIQPSEFITINTTEGEECKIIEKKTVTETVTRNLSSVIMYKKDLLIKTCFNPGKLVEIINKNNIIFSKTKANLNNIKYCYSTGIIDPNNSNKYAIFTYWTEFQIVNGKEKYIHKCILFDIEQNTFSNEITLTPYSNIINYLINDNYYPQNCITFRNRDIYCDIYFGSSESNFYENSFVIETQTLFTSGKINLVYSKDFDKKSFHRSISIGLGIHDLIEGGYFDVFLTQYHDRINSATFLLSSLYRKSSHSAYIFKFNLFRRYYGINIENQYVEPNLFNILIPNYNDLITVYIMKNNNKNILIMSRFNLAYTSESHSFVEMSISNYLREGDICSEPKYMQSMFVNSFINYNNKDKEIINKNGVDNYYKYQKDIVSLISCKNNQNIIYDTKKIIIPQCLKTLDEINDKDKHILRFENNQNIITFDIYNDPNYASLRDVGIEFIYESPILINYKLKGAPNFRALNKNEYNTTIIGITHIRFVKTSNIKSSIPLYLYYRLKKTDSSGNSMQCHLSSDKCELEFHINSDCNVQYCKYCFDNECQECEDIEGLKLDKTLNKCMCDEEKGFNPEPDMINKMCLCKPNYSFYKNTKICKENTILQKYFCSNRKDDVSNIPIYDDCTNCTQNGTCPDEDKTSDQCLAAENLEDNLWFKLGDYKFYYGKIEKCVYIFDNNLKLFFYSNKNDCSFGEDKMKYISICINHPEITDGITYYDFLYSTQEYNPYSTEVNIFKQIGNINFNLVNNQKNPKFSEVKLDDKILSQIKNIYNIPDNLNLLVFKGDIRRSDTISTQVEYQFYNPIPNKIYEKIDFSKLNISLRNLDTDIKNIEVNLSLPIHWSKEQFEIIKDLYYDQHIFIFDSSNPFFLDVCYKFKNSNNSDVYLQDRRDRYFINEAICEEGCHLVDDQNYYDVYEQASKLVCQCPMKLIFDNYTKIKFVKNETLDERFIEEFTFPNLRMFKCNRKIYYHDNIKVNVLFYITLFMFIAFLFLIVCMICCKCLFNRPFDELKEEIEKGYKIGNEEEEKNLKDSPDDKNNSEDEKKHKFEENDEKTQKRKQKEEDDERRRMLAYAEEDPDDVEQNINDEEQNINDNQENDNTVHFQDDENDNRPHMYVDPNQNINNIKISIMHFSNNQNKNKNKIKDRYDSVDPSESNKNSANISQSRNDTNSNINNQINEDFYKNTEEEKIINNNESSIIKSSNKENNNEKDENNNILNTSNNNIINTNSNEDKISESRQINRNKYEYDKDNDNNNNLINLTKSKLISSIESNSSLKKSQQFNSKAKEMNNDKKKDNNQDKDDEYEKIPADNLDDLVNFDNDNEKKNKKINKMNSFIIVEEKDQSEKKKKEKNKSNKNANPPRKETNPPEKETNPSEKDNQNVKKRRHDISNVKKKDQNKTDITNITKNSNDNSIIDPNPEKGVRIKENPSNPATERGTFIDTKTQNPPIIIKDTKNKENMMKYLKKKINRVEFEVAKNNDNRSFLNTIWSYEENNGIISFLFKCNENDILTRISLFLLTLALYIFINVMIMKSNAELNLYTKKNKEKILGGAISLNMFCPLLMYILIYFIKKKITVNEFFVNQYYQLYRVLVFLEDKKINVIQKDLGLHNIEAKISLRKNKAEFRLWFLFAIGTPFLLFNFLLVSSFCGIYENSVDCVIWNTVVSIIFSFIFSRAFLLISAYLRYNSLKNKDNPKEKLYIVSCLLNPYYLSYCGRKLCSNISKLCCTKEEQKNQNNNEDNKKENKEEKNLQEEMKDIQ